MIKSYKDLDVWKKGIELVEEIYIITKCFPRSEMFGLTSQMRRSAVSISSNIAEGWMRQHTKEYIQFVYHALGSCGELDTQLTIAAGIGYLKVEQAKELHESIDCVSKMLRNLVMALYRTGIPKPYTRTPKPDP